MERSKNRKPLRQSWISDTVLKPDSFTAILKIHFNIILLYHSPASNWQISKNLPHINSARLFIIPSFETQITSNPLEFLSYHDLWKLSALNAHKSSTSSCHNLSLPEKLPSTLHVYTFLPQNKSQNFRIIHINRKNCEVLMVVKMLVVIFRVVMLCSLVWVNPLTLNMETICSCEKLVTIYKTTHRHNKEDHIQLVEKFDTHIYTGSCMSSGRWASIIMLW